MPYAVTCRSCGARFSVADDLVQKRLAGRIVALKCKHCQKPIRVNASEPPSPRSSHPPAPNARSPLPQGPARPRPRPPLKARGAPAARRPPPPREQRSDPPGDNHDLFEAPPPSGGGPVDLSDMAHSEPPGSPSSAPPLFDLTKRERPPERSADDVDFLLGLSGSPGTTAALASPSLSDLAREVRSDPPSAPAPAPSRVRTTREAPLLSPPSEPPKRRKGLGAPLVLGLCALGLVGIAIVARAARGPSAATTESPLPTKPSVEVPPVALQKAPTAEPSTPPSSAAPRPTTNSGKAVAHGNENAKATAKPSAAGEAPSIPTEAAPTAPPAIPRTKEVAAPGTDFDRAAAASALASATTQASACRKDGDPSGIANVIVTFAPSGRVTSATVSGPPFAGTATGGCIAATLRRAKIPAFDGDKVSVSKTIVVE